MHHLNCHTVVCGFRDFANVHIVNAKETGPHAVIPVSSILLNVVSRHSRPHGLAASVRSFAIRFGTLMVSSRPWST